MVRFLKCTIIFILLNKIITLRYNQFCRYITIYIIIKIFIYFFKFFVKIPIQFHQEFLKPFGFTSHPLTHQTSENSLSSQTLSLSNISLGSEPNKNPKWVSFQFLYDHMILSACVHMSVCHSLRL